MKTRILHILVLSALLVGLFAPAHQVSATMSDPVRSKGVSPAGFLNQDGTLKLGSGFSGALDLSGWNVQVDPRRGPVFDPAGSPQASSRGVATGKWSNLGSGGSSLTGNVSAVAVHSGLVYVGGTFTNADNIPAADYIVMWDGEKWNALGNSAMPNRGSLNGPVYTITVGSTGDVYAGGDFTNVYNGGAPLNAADYVAKYALGTWSALGSGPAGTGSLNGKVTSLALDGLNLYVGGYFTDASNLSGTVPAADYVAKWDGSSWSALGNNGPGGNGSLNGAVLALALKGSNLYAGGSFTNVNNNGTSLTAADYVAKWDGADWSAMGGTSGGNGALNGAVEAIVTSGANVYVGGAFTTVSAGIFTNITGAHIAKWTGTGWTTLGSDGVGHGSLNNDVKSLAIISTDLYVGGWFTNVNNNGTVLYAADYVVKWDGTDWSALGSDGAGNGALSGGVLALALDSSHLYLGGSFANVHNGSVLLDTAGYAAIWNGTNWAGFGSSPAMGSLNDQVNAIAVIGSDVYVGGNFTNVNNRGTILTDADYIAKWDGANWSALGSNDGAGGNGSLNSYVYTLAASGTNLYVGGLFTDVNNNGSVLPAADYVAKWDGANWSAMGNNGLAENGSLNSFVYALAASGTNLYVGGRFTDVNNNGTVLPAADYVAKWDGANWSALGSNGAGDGSLKGMPIGTVEALAVSGTDVYVGGDFTDVNNNGTILTAADYVARWNGANWSALGSNGLAGEGSISFNVFALAVSGTDVYVGGYFTNVNNYGKVLNAADYIAKWDGTDWSALGSNGFAGDGSLNQSVKALAVVGLDLYVVGTFDDVNNKGTDLPGATYIARWDGADWSALTDVKSLNFYTLALAASDNNLYAGGMFQDVSNVAGVIKTADYIAVYGLTPSSSSVYLPLVIK